MGAAGIAVDIPALIALALRACNEYAAYYGFDPSIQAERAFVMKVLLAASSPSQVAKQAAMAELTRLAVMIQKHKPWRDLNKLVSVRLMKKLSEELGINLTHKKLAQVVPVVGPVVGAGYNAYYLGKVTEAAHMFYRERFLIEKYGSGIVIDVT